MFKGNLFNSVFRRGVHHKLTPKTYPQVQSKDVNLEHTRYGFRKERQPLISQGVVDTLFPNTEIQQKYTEAGKPVPIKYRTGSDDIARRNYLRFQEEVATGQPHFRVGEKKVYLPKARVILLRPNAKHTPYQAKFSVPRNFNKMDLRDYLWNIYGLRALNVTVQLMFPRWRRGPDDYARFREPQYKKMTIDMEEPFIWPDLPKEVANRAANEVPEMLRVTKQNQAIGSNVYKPSGAYGGIYDKPRLPNAFVPAKTRASRAVKVAEIEKNNVKVQERVIVSEYLGL